MVRFILSDISLLSINVSIFSTYLSSLVFNNVFVKSTILLYKLELNVFIILINNPSN